MGRSWADVGRSWADVGRSWADVIVFADHFTLHASDVVASSEENLSEDIDLSIHDSEEGLGGASLDDDDAW